MPEEGTIVQELPWYAKCSLDDVRCFIGANLKTVARCVVAVGYYLKQVRDRELWKDAEDAGYLSVWDFASREFGISKSTASRYMSINDRFSEGGDSPLILEKYAELSKSQLQEMLYLTDQQAEAVTPETTVQQIRAMRIPEPRPVEVLEGQMSLSDFLEDAPEPEEPETEESGFIMHVSAEDARCKTISEAVEPCVVTMDDLIPEEDAAAVATSQQEGTEPPAQPGQRNARVFQGIIVEYPSICAYPEYEGKPYFSIKYTENGQEFIGYGTYKPEVLSEYLKEYFMPPAQPSLYGYSIEHLAMVAEIMKKENVGPGEALQLFKSASYIAGLVRAEWYENLQRQMEQMFAGGQDETD